MRGPQTDNRGNVDPPDTHLSGALLGTALGDALGLPLEGLSARTIARRFGRGASNATDETPSYLTERFRLLGRTGYVSDDTEQSALVAQSLARHPSDSTACVAAFRRSMGAWLLRLPFGLGFSTLRACLRILVGLRPSGVASAGNGAAMRAAILGVFYRDAPETRRALGQALAEVTHRDPRGVAGALFVAEVAAAASTAGADPSPAACLRAALATVTEPTLRAALESALTLAERGASTQEAAAALGTTGYVIHTLAFASFCFHRFGAAFLPALAAVYAAGGDTDSIGAIVGAWAGALHGEPALPTALVDNLQRGPFGAAHLRALAAALSAARTGAATPPVRFSATYALLRNLLLYPVILAHGLRRLWPW